MCFLRGVLPNDVPLIFETPKILFPSYFVFISDLPWAVRAIVIVPAPSVLTFLFWLTVSLPLLPPLLFSRCGHSPVSKDILMPRSRVSLLFFCHILSPLVLSRVSAYTRLPDTLRIHTCAMYRAVRHRCFFPRVTLFNPRPVKFRVAMV